jgi:archaemetzincin
VLEKIKKGIPTMGLILAVAAAVAFVVYVHVYYRGVPKPIEHISPFHAKVCVVPVGEVPEADVAFVCDVLEAHLGREVVVREPLPLQDEYYDPARDQYSAGGLLTYVEANAPAESYRVVGVTAADITVSQLNFVFGLARCPGKCTVMSTYRLGRYCDSDEQRLVRFAKLIIHETGHTFGLAHCRQRRCAMKFAEGYVTMDEQRPAFCERCELRFCTIAAQDPAERRDRLEAVFGKYGLMEEVGVPAGLTPAPAPFDPTPEEGIKSIRAHR